MSDEKFQEFLQRELRDYNAPPAETPRDAMWQAIAEARAARRTSVAAPPQGGSGGAGGSALRGSSARRPFGAYAPWIGMAATLLVGIGIGRFVMSSPTATTVAQADSSRGLPIDPSNTTAPEPAAETSPALSAPATAPAAVASVPAGRSAGTGTRNATEAAPRALPAATRAAPSTAFTLASRDHLQRAEALVSVVAATPADATMDSLTGKWARQMLTNTRLLLDSPAGDDPVRRRLLEDLETVLVQLIQRSGAAAEERELLDRTLERTQLLTRLRSGAAGL